MAVDPAIESAIPENPQTWNRYTYALNNPLQFVDPDGRSPAKLDGALVEQMMQKASQEAAEQQAYAAYEQRQQEFAQAISDTASAIGDVADLATIACLAIPAAQPAAPVVAAIGAVADGVAWSLDAGDPGKTAALAANALGGMAGGVTAVMAKEGAPLATKAVIIGAAVSTAQLVNAVSEPALLNTLELIDASP